jgi:hypothetical protein
LNVAKTTCYIYASGFSKDFWLDDFEIEEVKPFTVTTPISGYWWASGTSEPSFPSSSWTWVARSTVSATTAALAESNGNYIYVKAEDGAGNVSATRQYGPFWIDTQAPNVSGTFNYGTPTETTIPVTISGAADATSGLPGAAYYIEYDANATTFASADANSGWCNGSWTPTGLTENMPYAFRWKVKDNTGNQTGWYYPSPAYIYTISLGADVVEANGRSTNVYYEGDGLTFNFSSARLTAGRIAYYKYIWDTSPATSAASGTTWSSSTIALPTETFVKINSRTLYLHVLAYNTQDTPNTEGTKHYGPFIHVNTSRKLRHDKWFDDDANLIEMGIKQ